MMGRTGNMEYVKNRQSISRNSNSYHILDLEIDSNLNACSSNICDVSHKEIPLYKYTDIPDFLQGNPYVIHGYRVMLPFSLCLKRYTFAIVLFIVLEQIIVVVHVPLIDYFLYSLIWKLT